MPALLAPLFLVGLAALAWPLLAHLAERERRDPVAFPSFMFLERTPAPITARRQLRDPWLFALRAAALAALAFAFARPVLTPRAAALGADPRRRDIVVLLDRSFSMRVGDRFARAKAEVQKAIGGLHGGDRMTLVAFDRRAHAITRTTGDQAALRAALDSVSLTDESTRLGPAVALAQQLIGASDAPRKALLVVSDFQRSAWDLGDDARLPPLTEVASVDVGGGAIVANHGVRSVDVRRDRTGGAERVVVSARLANTGDAVRALAVRLEVAGRIVEQKRVDLPRDGGVTVSFAALTAPSEPVAARVTLDADALAGDDAFHFVLTRAPVVSVLLVGAHDSPFLPRALAVGDDPAFEVTVRTAEGATTADLAGKRVVVLADGAMPAAGGARLAQFVAAGGGLVTLLGERAAPRSWPTAARSLVPGALGPAIDRVGQGGAVLGTIDRQHPALSVFAGPHAGDLGAPRFYKYRPIDTTGGVLARFDDGTVALTEHAVGSGRVLTFASTFDGLWNDLPRQPVFLPLVHQLVRHAAAYRAVPRARAIGESLLPSDFGSIARDAGARWSVLAPSRARITIGGTGASPTLELGEAGIYELRPGGAPEARALLVASNITPSELDFTAFDPVRLTNALLASGSAGAPVGSTALAESLAERESHQSSWWYLLAAVALLLAAETLLAWRTLASRSKNGATP